MVKRYVALITAVGLLTAVVSWAPVQEFQRELAVIDKIKLEVRQTPQDADVRLVALVGDYLKKIKIPAPARKIFNANLAIRNPHIVDEIPQGKYVRSGVGITGTTQFNNVSVQCTVYVLIDTEFRPQFVVSVELPAGYKVGDLFPSLKKLNELSLPRVKLVFSTIDLVKGMRALIYKRIEVADFEHVLILPGLNFIASLDLAGPLDSLRRLKERAKHLDAIVIRDEPIYLKGRIPYKVTDSYLSAIIPIRIGIDFTKIPGIPKSVTDVFKELSTDDLALDLEFPFKLTVEAGTRITLGTQKAPIRLTGVGAVGKKFFSLGARMRNQLELKWLSMGDAGFQVDFDTAVMGATGLPFSGLGAYGKIQVGKAGPSRIAYETSAALQVKKDEIPGLLWHVEASNIRFEDIIELLITIARNLKRYKKPFPADRIPVMRINKLRGYLATETVVLARKVYRQGFGLTFDIDMFGQKVFLNINLIPEELELDGVGYLSNIELKTKKGKTVFSLTGPGLDQQYGTKDDGPVAFCSFDAKHPGSGAFGLRGTMEIPPLGLKSKVEFIRSKFKMTADIENKIAGFTTLLQCKVDPLQIKTMFIRIGFKKDFDQFLIKVMLDLLTKSKKKIESRLKELNKKVDSLSKKIGSFGKKATMGTNAKIKKVEAEIKALTHQYNELNKKVKAAPKGKQKRKARQARRTVSLKLKKKRAYLKLILKPAKIVAVGATAIAKVNKDLADAKLFQKAVGGTLTGIAKTIDAASKGARIITVKEVVGSYSMPDMLAGKSPKLDTFVATASFPGLPSKTVSLKNVQFDFRKPVQAATNLAKSIFKTVGLRYKVAAEHMAKRKAERQAKRRARRA